MLPALVSGLLRVREAVLPIVTVPPVGLVSVPLMVLAVPLDTEMVPAELLFTGALIVALSKSRLAEPVWVTAPPLITVPPSNSSVPALFWMVWLFVQLPPFTASSLPARASMVPVLVAPLAPASRMRVPPLVASSVPLLVSPLLVCTYSGVDWLASMVPWLTSAMLLLPMFPDPWMVLFTLVSVLPADEP